MKSTPFVSALLIILFSTVAFAQSTASELEFVKADPKDVASIDALVNAYYDSLCGAAGDRRTHNKRYASLFAKTAWVVTPTLRTDEGKMIPNARPITDWMTRYPDERENDFYEWETARRTEQFGHMAQVFSTYENGPKDRAEPNRHGITAFELAKIDGRWWIVTLQWSGQPVEQPLPERYQSKR
jgi:hypothetical protein